MENITIKDLENLSGIKAHTIRIWEKRYSFLKPNRTNTNIRLYSKEQLKILLNVSLLNKNGTKISQIDSMSDEEIKKKIFELPQINAQHERLVNELIFLMIELKFENFEDIIDTYAASNGIERTISDIVFLFIKKVGILFKRNNINAAQEKLITIILRQKIIAGIENSDKSVINNKTVLLFLPEDEHDELPLLMLHYLLNYKGVDILYLGAGVPVKDLEYTNNVKTPHCMFTNLTKTSSGFSFERFLKQMSKYTSNIPLVITGTAAQYYKKEIPSNIHLKPSLSEAADYIASL